MSDLITDAMVEAAAVVLRNQLRERVGLSPLDRLPWSPASDEVRGDARAALEAVAPLIAAKALRDAADAWQVGGWSESLPHRSDRPALILGMAQRATTWLRARAEHIGGES